MKKLQIIFTILFFVVCSYRPSFADDLYSKYLSGADVEKITGYKGIHEVPYDPSKGAGGNINYADSEGRLVVMANFQDHKYYEQTKKQKGYFKTAVQDVGDEAFLGPSTGPEYVLIFRKGEHAVSVTSFFNLGGPGSNPTMLTKEQLIAIGKSIAAKF